MRSAAVTTPPDDQARRRRVRRTAVLLGFVALMFYIGFIAIGALRA
jgi:hypothetical protein